MLEGRKRLKTKKKKNVTNKKKMGETRNFFPLFYVRSRTHGDRLLY